MTAPPPQPPDPVARRASRLREGPVRRTLAHRLAPLRRQWQALPRRQRLLACVAAGLVAGAWAWWVLLGPALATLREAPAQHQALDAQLAQVRALQAQAQALQSLPRMGRDEARRALEASVAQALAGTGRLVIAADSATVTLTNVSGDALAQWLAQARINARAIPADARLTRNASGLWDGTLVLTLPPA